MTFEVSGKWKLASLIDDPASVPVTRMKSPDIDFHLGKGQESRENNLKLSHLQTSPQSEKHLSFSPPPPLPLV